MALMRTCNSRNRKSKRCFDAGNMPMRACGAHMCVGARACVRVRLCVREVHTMTATRTATWRSEAMSNAPDMGCI